MNHLKIWLPTNVINFQKRRVLRIKIAAKSLVRHLYCKNVHVVPRLLRHRIPVLIARRAFKHTVSCWCIDACTLANGHLCAVRVAKRSLRLVTCRYTSEYTRARSHTRALCVIKHLLSEVSSISTCIITQAKCRTSVLSAARHLFSLRICTNTNVMHSACSLLQNWMKLIRFYAGFVCWVCNYFLHGIISSDYSCISNHSLTL